MVGYRDRPSFGQGGGDQQKLQLGQRARWPSPVAATHRTENSGMRRRRSRTGTTAPGRAVRGRARPGRSPSSPLPPAGRSCPSSGRAAGWPWSAAGSGPETPAPRRASAAPCRAGVLITGRRLVERVVRRQQRAGLGLQFLDVAPGRSTPRRVCRLPSSANEAPFLATGIVAYEDR